MPDRVVTQVIAATCFPTTHQVEPLGSDNVWEILRVLESSPRAGRSLFSAAGAAARVRWEEFAGYIKQAWAYFQAGQRVEGVSSALLFYYAALQLAKAELLMTNPNDILGLSIHHGLKHDIGHAGNPKKDSLGVRSRGVFPLLYKKRTGYTLPAGASLALPTLLQHVPEVASELEKTAGLSGRLIPINIAVVGDGNDFWAIILSQRPSFLTNLREPASRLFLGVFEETALHPDWKTIFGVSTRGRIGKPMMYQSRKTYPQGQLTDAKVVAMFRPLANHLDNPLVGHVDAYYHQSYPNLRLPMTAGLARYALMYYLSSLVRYKPSILASGRYPDLAYVLHLFCRVAAVPLVVNAADAILGRWHWFGVAGRV